MTGRTWTALAGSVTLWLHAAAASAQQVATPVAARFEISAGLGWIGASTIGSRDATLTVAAGDRFRLFSTSSDLASAPEFHVRLSDRVARAIDAEVAASFSRPVLRTTITADAEAPSATVASVSVTQLTFEGGVRVSPRAWSAGRARLFIVGGGGYLRQLYEGKTLVESGRVAYVGGGVALPLRAQRRSGQSRRVGLRVDLRAMAFSGGIAIDESTRVSPVLTGSIFGTF